MNTRSHIETDVNRMATADDVRHTLGDIDGVLIAAILSVKPTFRELTDAAIWARGDGDLIAREHHELSAGALAVAEIITRDEDADRKSVV